MGVETNPVEARASNRASLRVKPGMGFCSYAPDSITTERTPRLDPDDYLLPTALSRNGVIEALVTALAV